MLPLLHANGTGWDEWLVVAGGIVAVYLIARLLDRRGEDDAGIASNISSARSEELPVDTNTSTTDLAAAVAAFSQAGMALPDGALEGSFSHEQMVGAGRWQGYGGVREAFFRIYLELRELAVLTASERERGGNPISAAQRILGQHHAAWRDLTGALAGVADGEIDREPAPGEWPLRTVLEHIIDAEAGFYALIANALAVVRGTAPVERDPDPDVSGTLAEIMGRFAVLHGRVLDEFAGISDGELLAPSRFWEGYDIEIRFRLLRFDAHLREHTIQADKTLLGIGHPLPETRRLVRLIHNALAEAEAARIGAPDAAQAEWARVAEQVRRLAGDLAGVA